MEEPPAIFKEAWSILGTLERHIDIIRILLAEQPLGIIKISQETGIPEHKVRYSLRVLEENDVIEPSKSGARLTPGFMGNRLKVIEEAEKVSEEFRKFSLDLKKMLS